MMVPPVRAKFWQKINLNFENLTRIRNSRANQYILTIIYNKC